MRDLVGEAALIAKSAGRVYCKFLAANDTGKTGGHQSGIYIAKKSASILMGKEGQRGDNKDLDVKITWHGNPDITTESKFRYYGNKTRNEYRITAFGRGFPYLQEEYTGALFVLFQMTMEQYDAFVFNDEETINEFLDIFNISSTETNELIDNDKLTAAGAEHDEIMNFIHSLDVEFPTSEDMSAEARRIEDEIHDPTGKGDKDVDRKLIQWTNEEYRIFRALEKERYGAKISNGFSNFEDFILTANKVLNRRKSRAGKSLENHLEALFKRNNLQFTPQGETEGHKRPDFIFPSVEAYHNPDFPADKLITLAAKTTCKDRWRQILNEADRRKGKDIFLCTLQQSISADQLKEMEEEHVILVVPEPYIRKYPSEYKEKIWSLEKFISYVKNIEKSL